VKDSLADAVCGGEIESDVRIASSIPAGPPWPVVSLIVLLNVLASVVICLAWRRVVDSQSVAQDLSKSMMLKR
jgi:hypothetical protein